MDSEVYSEFVIEAREHLETIEPRLLDLEKDPGNLEILDDIFRPMHSLKGASGFLDLNNINVLAHRAENVLDELRKGNMQVNSEIMDIILDATDALRTMIENLDESGEEGDVEKESLIKRLDEVLEGPPKGSEANKQLQQGPKQNQSGQKSNYTEDLDKQDTESVVIDYANEHPYSLSLASPEHLSDFLEECEEIIDNLSSCFLQIEKDPSSGYEQVQDAFRYFHNLKGNSGIVGYKELNDVTHQAETLLNEYRSTETIPNQRSIDLFLQVIDGIEILLQRIDSEKGEVTPSDISPLLERLEQAASSGTEQREEIEESTGDEQAEEEGQEVEVDREDLDIFKETATQQMENINIAMEKLQEDSSQQEYIDALYRSLVTLQNSSNYMGYEELQVYAERTANLVDQGRNSGMDFEPMLAILDQEISIIGDMVDKAIQEAQEAVEQEELPLEEEKEEAEEQSEPAPAPKQGKSEEQEETVQAQEEIESVSTPAAESAEPATEPLQEKEKEAKSEEKPAAKEEAAKPSKKEEPNKGKGKVQEQAGASTTIRVDHEKLDHLMNLIGELIINRNRFSMLAKALEGGEDVPEIAQSLTETTYSMARISDDLQDTIMNVRMMAVRTVFSKFPRLVRDLSRKSGKKVELITEGEETELDKSVVEVIGDPLVHLVRNSLDHGLEREEERVSAGKDPVGHVWLRAYHKGNAVVIEVEDDGKGIDPQKTREKAIEKGIISEEEANKMDERESVDLIFAPGFSTAEAITDISGRGVGMDVVRNNIKNLNGSITVQSEIGKGSKFTLTLPLTLAIIDALMVKSAGDTYAIPLDAVSETTKIEAEKLNEVNKRKAITMRGEVLGIIELSEILGLKNGQDDRELLPLVIISVNERRLGLVVDTLLERQEIVIKSMGEYLGDVVGISGATIMGDGSVVLILDPNEIFMQASRTSY